MPWIHIGHLFIFKRFLLYIYNIGEYVGITNLLLKSMLQWILEICLCLHILRYAWLTFKIYIYIWKTKLSSEEVELTFSPTILENKGNMPLLGSPIFHLFAVTVLSPSKFSARFLSLIIRITLSNRNQFILKYKWPLTSASIFLS